MVIYQVVKEKTNIRGYWKDVVTGKLYKDNIKLKPYSNKLKKELFARGELSVFIYDTPYHAILESANGSVITLNTCSKQRCKKLKASTIKYILSKYGGLTIYYDKKLSEYTLEVWI